METVAGGALTTGIAVLLQQRGMAISVRLREALVSDFYAPTDIGLHTYQKVTTLITT